MTVKIVLPMAWRHICGQLNEGIYKAGDSVCVCRADVPPEDVEARYLLTEITI